MLTPERTHAGDQCAGGSQHNCQRGEPGLEDMWPRAGPKGSKLATTARRRSAISPAHARRRGGRRKPGQLTFQTVAEDRKDETAGNPMPKSGNRTEAAGRSIRTLTRRIPPLPSMTTRL